MMRPSWLSALVLASCSAREPAPPPVSAPPAPVAQAPAAASNAPLPASVDKYDSIVAAPDRDAADRALDAGRHPAELLRFFGIKPGMKVAEISAGGGYTAELLARTVGDGGRVYATNSKFILERFAEKPWSARLTKSVMKNVVRVDRDFDDPLPPDAKDLDVVLIVLFYHDTVWMKTDRQRMNAAILAALRPGGVYGVVDHSSKSGSGTADAETLHRIDERLVRDEVSRAGFVFREDAVFLKNPSDPRDWNASPRQAGERRGSSDRFVLKFEKPQLGSGMSASASSGPEFNVARGELSISRRLI
jgi:predicted methyltransferase